MSALSSVFLLMGGVLGLGASLQFIRSFWQAFTKDDDVSAELSDYQEQVALRYLMAAALLWTAAGVWK